MDAHIKEKLRVFSRKLGKLPLSEPIVCFWDTRRIDHSFNRSRHVVRACSRHVVRMCAHSLGKNRSRWDFLVFTIDFLIFENIHVHTFTSPWCAVVEKLNSYLQLFTSWYDDPKKAGKLKKGGKTVKRRENWKKGGNFEFSNFDFIFCKNHC